MRLLITESLVLFKIVTHFFLCSCAFVDDVEVLGAIFNCIVFEIASNSFHAMRCRATAISEQQIFSTEVTHHYLSQQRTFTLFCSFKVDSDYLDTSVVFSVSPCACESTLRTRVRPWDVDGSPPSHAGDVWEQCTLVRYVRASQRFTLAGPEAGEM